MRFLEDMPALEHLVWNTRWAVPQLEERLILRKIRQMRLLPNLSRITTKSFMQVIAEYPYAFQNRQEVSRDHITIMLSYSYHGDTLYHTRYTDINYRDVFDGKCMELLSTSGFEPAHDDEMGDFAESSDEEDDDEMDDDFQESMGSEDERDMDPADTSDVETEDVTRFESQGWQDHFMFRDSEIPLSIMESIYNILGEPMDWTEPRRGLTLPRRAWEILCNHFGQL